MFDIWPDVLTRVDDSTLVDQMTAATRLEAWAAAARWAAIAELVDRRVANQGDRQWWACDGWAECTAEVGAALTIGTYWAGIQMSNALRLRDDLPRIGKLLADGVISAAMASTICWRTQLVDDPDTLTELDAALSQAVGAWGALSQKELKTTIDAVITTIDPAAVIKTRDAARSRDIHLGKPDDVTGTRSIYGALTITDAAILEERLTTVAHGVCADDPRNLGQRRSDAMGVIGAGGHALSCLCGNPDCPSASVPDARASSVVIHVLTDTVPEPVSAPAPCPGSTSLGVLPGGQIIPPNMLADLVARGAKVCTMAIPHQQATSAYRPSRAQRRFVQLRYLTCGFPGCDKPAVGCDIDHVVAWPVGLTHVGNLGPKCRLHHLLKTFWTGPNGWSDRMEPDGTVVWTSPTGHEYRKAPLSRIIVPDKVIRTPLPAPPPRLDAPSKGVMMPRRRRTRHQDHAAYIAQQRRLNEQYLAEPPP